jgi:DNA-binding transcriptional LysR family regulator
MAIELSREILRSYDRIRGDISRLDDPAARIIRVAASTTPGEYLAPELVAGFADVMPAVLTQVTISDSTAVFRDLLAGRADVGFSGMKPDHASLVAEPISTDEILLAVPANHASAGGSMEIDQLHRERLILREGGSATIQTVRQVLAERGMSLPPRGPSLTLSSTQSIMSAVASGLGVGFVTSRAFERSRMTGVAPARIAGAPIWRELYLVYPTQSRLPSHVRTFIDFVRSRSAHAG